MASDWLEIRLKQLKARQSRQNQVYTWPFQAKNSYDVRLANRRAPGV